MIEKFTSVRQTIAKVYRDLNIQDEDRWMDMIEWAAEALEQIGAYQQYVHKADTLDIENYRAALPCDLHKVVGITIDMEALKYNAGTFDTAQEAENNINIRTTSHSGYTMNDGFFNFNFEQGKAEIAYMGIPLDEEGFPMVPDNISYREAIEKYIVMKMMYGKWITGQLQAGIWQDIKNDWHWFCGQARGKGYMPNADKMESIKNQWNRLKPEMNQHKRQFANLSNIERITRG
jgi:hypothetical protein